MAMAQAHRFQVSIFVDTYETDFYLSSRIIANNYILAPSNLYEGSAGFEYHYFFNKKRGGLNLKSRLNYSNNSFEMGIYSGTDFISVANYKAEFINVYLGLGYAFSIDEKFSLEPAGLLGFGIPLWKENELYTGSPEYPDPLSMGSELLMIELNLNIEYKLVETYRSTWSIGIQPRVQSFMTNMYNLNNYAGSESKTPHFGFGLGLNISYYFR